MIKKHGYYKIYNKNQKIDEIYKYNNDNVVEYKLYDENGQLKEIKIY